MRLSLNIFYMKITSTYIELNEEIHQQVQYTKQVKT